MVADAVPAPGAKVGFPGMVFAQHAVCPLLLNQSLIDVAAEGLVRHRHIVNV